MRIVLLSTVVSLLLGLGPSTLLAQSAGTVGAGGNASADGTSATTLGTGGAATDADGSYTGSIASGGSAATEDGKAKSQTKIIENPNMLQGNSKAMAHDGGTFSKSMTKTRVKGDDLSSRTKTMSHVPGEKPAKDTTTVETQLPQ